MRLAMGPLYALRPRNAWHRLERPRPQSASSLAPVAALGSPPGREDVKRPRPSARRPAQLNQRLDVADVRLRPTGGTGEVPINVGDGITTFRPIAVFSKVARKTSSASTLPVFSPTWLTRGSRQAGSSSAAPTAKDRDAIPMRQFQRAAGTPKRAGPGRVHPGTKTGALEPFRGPEQCLQKQPISRQKESKAPSTPRRHSHPPRRVFRARVRLLRGPTFSRALPGA